jgi:hypothetical protein
MSSHFKKIKATDLEYYYGIDFHNGSVISVTDIVLKNCLQPNGDIFFNGIKNNLFGDPYYGHVKTLYCVYENNVIKKVLESVNQRFESDVIMYIQSFDLKQLNYYYGISFPNLVENVTEKVLNLENSGNITISFNYNELFGDPYYGHVKTFFIVNENKILFSFTENQPVYLTNIKMKLYKLKEYESDFSTVFQPPDTRFFYGSDFDQLSEITSLVFKTYTNNDGTIQIPSGNKIWEDGNDKPNFIFIQTTKYVHKIKGWCSVSMGNKPKNIIISGMGVFNENSGGITCCYKMANILENLSEGWWVKIHGGPNPYHNDLWHGEPFDKENTVVIYCEGVNGNPLDAKYVVRWILAPLGTFGNHHQYLNYNPHDLVYYFNTENRFYNKSPSIFKLLTIVNIPCIDFDSSPRPLQYCHTWRKSQMHSQILPIHPPNSVELNGSLQDFINAFKSFEYFISYDPLTFYSLIAAMSGCISIVYPLEGLSKKDWYKKTCASEYLEKNNVDLYGIAYGNSPEEIEFAKSTLHLCQTQWLDIESFMIENTIQPFIEDIANFESQLNTVEHNYLINFD